MLVSRFANRQTVIFTGCTYNVVPVCLRNNRRYFESVKQPSCGAIAPPFIANTNIPRKQFRSAADTSLYC